MMSNWSKTSIIVLVLMFWKEAAGQSLTETRSLYNTLMQNYDKRIRPVKSQNETVKIYVSYRLLSLQDFNDLTGLLKLTASLSLEWTDSRFMWNASDYNDMNSIIMPYQDIWGPELVMMNAPDHDFLPGLNAKSIRIYSDGLVSLQSFDFLHVSCSVDIKDYPYDTQSCSIVIIPWGYTPTEVRFTLLSELEIRSAVLTEYIDNSAWLVSDPTYSVIHGRRFSGFKVDLTFKRRFSYVIANLIIPVFILSFLNTWVFLLPSESGERISFSITVFLSFAVYMTILSDHMPKGSEPLAKLNYQMIFMLLYSVSILFCTIMSLRMYNNTDRKDVPNYLRKILTTFRCKKCLPATKNIVNAESSRIQGDVVNTQHPHVNNHRRLSLLRQQSKQHISILEEETFASEDTKPTSEEEVTWIEVGQMFDRFAFILHTVWWIILVTLQSLISVQNHPVSLDL